MPLTRDELQTLQDLKSRTSGRPLDDPLFASIDESVRAALSADAGIPEDQLKELVVRIYHQSVTSTAQKRPALERYNKVASIYYGLRRDPCNDFSKTSITLTKFVKRVLNAIKPFEIGFDVYLLELLRKAVGDDILQQAVDYVREAFALPPPEVEDPDDA